MKKSLVVTVVLALAAAVLPLASATGASTRQPRDSRPRAHAVMRAGLSADPGQHGGSDGHLPASSENVKLVSELRLTSTPGGISDVAAHNGYAYLGAWREECPNGGVHVVDFRRPRNPRRVAFIAAGRNNYVTEGVQALRLETRFFTGDVLVYSNEACDSSLPHNGGLSIWDVRDPRNPRPLVQGAGDLVPSPPKDDTPLTEANQSHSVRAWRDGKKAYAVLVDNEEFFDVDIMDITNPRAPRLIAETGIENWPDAIDDQAFGIGTFPVSLHHDMWVKKVDGHWLVALSYWDAGQVILNVDDPANPVFVTDSTYPHPDPLTGLAPEGNSHQSTWSRNNEFILATDEDFDAFRLVSTITSGPFAGQGFSPQQALGAPQLDAETGLAGPTFFVGRACSEQDVPRARSEDAIAVIERGDCFFSDKAANVAAAGYAAGIVFNNETGELACEEIVGMVAESPIPFLGVLPRSDGFAILGIEGYSPDNCPGGDNPALPREGEQGADISIEAVFDGWGYLRLLDATTLEELDQFAIDEALDESFAQGFGDLTIHEVKVDRRKGVNLAYASWYSGGLRVIEYGRDGLDEVGHYVAADGNNFWGTFPYKRADKRPLLLMSDRDSGLWIFKYTGPE